MDQLITHAPDLLERGITKAACVIKPPPLFQLNALFLQCTPVQYTKLFASPGPHYVCVCGPKLVTSLLQDTATFWAKLNQFTDASSSLTAL